MTSGVLWYNEAMTETVRLTERHFIKSADSRFEAIDQAAFASKNLYNLANYHVRQSFIGEGVYFNYVAIYHQVKHSDAFATFPRKVSQMVLRQLHQSWTGFFAAIKVWAKNPSLFTGRPSLPGYKSKQEGRNVLIYNNQAFSKKALKKGLIKPSGLGITVQTKQENVDIVRIVPRQGHYVVEVVYSVEVEPNPDLGENLVAGIDIGLNNLAALTSNKLGFKPLLVSGRPLKSINQFYNKRKAELQSKLGSGQHTSKRIRRLTEKRNRKRSITICITPVDRLLII